MANYIYTVLMSKVMVVLSWGFNSPIAITDGLRFKVQGFKFTGTVEVIYNEGVDLFEVHLSDGRVEADVYADCLGMLLMVWSSVQTTIVSELRKSMDFNL